MPALPVSKLSVGKTCEGDGSSGVAEIYSRFIFYTKVEWDAPLVPLDSSQWVLHELGRGESVNNPNISLMSEMNVADAVRAARDAGRNYITIASEFLARPSEEMKDASQ